MGGQVVAAVSFGNECAQLDVLEGHLLATDAHGQDAFQFRMVGLVSQCLDELHLLSVQVLVQSFQHPVESHFRRVGDERKYSMTHLIVHCLQNLWYQLLTQHFPFPINVFVTTPTEVDTFEGAGGASFRTIDFRQAHFPVPLCQQCLSRQQLMYLFPRHINNRLYHRTLAGKNQYLVVLIPKSGTNPPRITHRKTLSTTGHSAYHVTTVPSTACSLQYFRQIDTFLDGTSDIESFQSFFLALMVQMFHLTVQPMSQLFQKNISIGIPTWMLPFGCNACKNLIYVCQIEITTNG